MRPPVILCCAVLLVLSGCIRTIAITTVGGIVQDGFSAFMEEADLDIVEKALPANLKLLEVMLKNEPDDTRLLLLLSEGYSSYALGFVEDTDVERARALYKRGRDFGLRALQQNPALATALAGTADELKSALARLGREDVPAVFWTAFGWGSYVNLSLTNPEALTDLPRVEAMMQFVALKDSAFYYGGAHVFLGTLYGGRPRILGGDPELSRRHFETALRLNDGKFLMTYIYFARSLAVQTMDEPLFDKLLGLVNGASLEVLPEFRLANAIAKKKAGQLIIRRADLF